MFERGVCSIPLPLMRLLVDSEAVHAVLTTPRGRQVDDVRDAGRVCKGISHSTYKYHCRLST